MGKKYINSSDIESYLYCKHSWYLKQTQKNQTNQNTRAGEQHEAKVQKGRYAAIKKQAIKKWLSRSWWLLLLVTMSLTALILEMIYLELLTYGIYFIAGTTVILSIAAATLTTQLQQEKEILKIARKENLVLSDEPLTEKKTIYRDEINFISAEPDYVIIKNGHHAPVEIKKANNPPNNMPRLNHMYQVWAMLHCMEQNNLKVQEGYLTYKDKTYTIEWDEARRMQLLNLIQEIRELKETQKIPPRDHQVKAKCHGCTYRDKCNEKL